MGKTLMFSPPHHIIIPPKINLDPADLSAPIRH